MDFVFATFPWLIARQLEMRRNEKIGLCVTMSLGLMYVPIFSISSLDVKTQVNLQHNSVAIVSAIRVSWKDEGNARDEHYFYRNGLSQIW